MDINVAKYKTIVFDCDGVVLDSNITKIDSYFRTAKKLGATDAQAQALVDHHVEFGGISRYPKFVWYIKEVLKKEPTQAEVQEYLDAFSLAVKKGLMRCKIADGLQALRDQTPEAKWMVVSGGDQQEIRDLFEKRALAHLFDSGLFGSPANKDEILKREKENGNIIFPALFIGDSKYDYESSTRAGLDFVFLSSWTDVPDWKVFCQMHQINVVNNVQSLIY
ncbi:MAG: HAD hydrolase-like protein [Methylophilaceae bacterium]|nr:HAD hydrolase-like protein [Methylophilaceae bacterium]